MPNLYTIADYAQRVGCSRTYIYKLEKQGRIKFHPGKKKVDAIEADPILKFREAGRETSKVRQKNGGKRSKETPSSDELPELSEKSTYDELDRIKLYEQARKLRLDNDKKEGTTTDKLEAKNIFFQAARDIRAACEALPARATSIIIGMNLHDTEQALKKEVNRILMNLSEDILK